MESMEYTKIAAAILTAGIAFSALGLISNKLVHPEELAKSAITIAGVPAAGGEAPKPAVQAAPPILKLLASATPQDGEELTHKVCIACHNFTPGGGNKVGPDLYGVVGRERTSYPGYSYSSALKSKPGKWTYATLNEWLYDPQTYAPGTKMSYTGVKSDKVRASLIDYLRTLSPSPEPLPTAAEISAEESAAKADSSKSAAAMPATTTPSLPPLEPLLAKADPDAGKAFTRKICIACHNFTPDGGSKVGPDLYGVVGRERASFPGFSYSTALKSKPGKWTFATLNEWLHKPQDFAPGTKMAYAGIENAQTRADVIDYLRTLSPDPEPLPGAAASPATPAKPVAPAMKTPAAPQ